MSYSKGSLDGGEWLPDCACGGWRGSAGMCLANRAVPYTPAWIRLCVAMDISCPGALSPFEAVPRPGTARVRLLVLARPAARARW